LVIPSEASPILGAILGLATLLPVPTLCESGEIIYKKNKNK
jgi:hypothetical protein